MAKEILKLSLDKILEFNGKFSATVCSGFDIGDWETVDAGNFTMSIIQFRKPNEFIGTIKDKYGISCVLGKLDDKNIRFIKKYLDVKKGGSDKPILYEGHHVGKNKYEGLWYPRGECRYFGNNTKYPFKLKLKKSNT
jgi:hypothetical protein